MQANPILVQTIRGNWVENRHRGAMVLADAEGQIVASLGDTDWPVFPRSAIKSMQALAMVGAGAIERFALSDEDLALACASHHGETDHVAGVTRFLGEIGLAADALECGAHAPTNPAARSALRAAGEEPSALHNNCSGKHAGMLSVARALGVPPEHYVDPDHPVQQRVRAAVETVLGVALTTERCGTDGCSIPTYAAPLSAFAGGFARMATGQGLSPELGAAAMRLFDAATSHPHLVAGTGHFDTLVMEAFGGRVMQKGGAEGVQCGAIRDLGLGYAIKCDDGNMAASQAMAAGLLLAVARPDAKQTALLQRYARQIITNVRRREVGMMAVTDAVFEAFGC
ncbi:asparaginase [Arsenicitalea aurantiaca]|uniref:Asparaginase n=1 Tax=Arsenicitalea aurantiaca TaxID=1783274 RepID=A0A433XAG8_9HYPH|nr:asparaginase [Arsenicitalea aurantiaca]RUT31044.1 asparaginase [Arsenicitalea aurantiaca]